MTREIQFLIKKENVNLKELVKKYARKAQGTAMKEKAEEEAASNPHINYGLMGNRITLRIGVSVPSWIKPCYRARFGQNTNRRKSGFLNGPK